VRVGPFRTGVPFKVSGLISDCGHMTPRPPTRRLLAVLTVFSMLFVSQAMTSFASDRSPRDPDPGTIHVNDGDPATDPSVADTTTPPPGSHRSTSPGFTDVPKGFWAGSAINTVAVDNTWMKDFGSSTFKPDNLETRELFAKAVVQAFAPTQKADPHMKFGDVDPSDPNAPYISVAVKNSWMLPFGKNFHPTDPVSTIQVHRALIWALGLSDVVAGANQMHTTDGYVFQHGSTFGTRLVGAVLGLRYNHDDESMDVGPGSRLNRAEVAWSLYRADVINTSESWRKSEVQIYKSIHLGPIPAAFRPVVEYGMKFVGFPYIYAGEWNVKSPAGYCCGYQPRGGFDCSGLMWWVLRQGDSLYDSAKYHPDYPGFILNERSSNDMSKAIPVKDRLTFDQVKAGDLLFYDSNSDGTIDHVDLNLGWGWALDSGSNGVTIAHVGEKGSWYQDVFAWGRRPVPAKR
jgi:cell wall-associated NlpC family hydrolase